MQQIESLASATRESRTDRLLRQSEERGSSLTIEPVEIGHLAHYVTPPTAEDNPYAAAAVANPYEGIQLAIVTSRHE